MSVNTRCAGSGGGQDGLSVEDVMMTGSVIIQSDCRFVQELLERGINTGHDNQSLVSPPPYTGKALVIGELHGAWLSSLSCLRYCILLTKDTHTHTRARTHARARARTHARTHTHTRTRTQTHTHTHTHTPARARAHTHTHTHTEAYLFRVADCLMVKTDSPADLIPFLFS